MFEVARSSLDSAWSAPADALGGWMTDDEANATMNAAATRMFVTLSGGEVHDFTRATASGEFGPASTLLFHGGAPAVDADETVVYYNCASTICARSLSYDPPPHWFQVGDERHIGMGPPLGAWDPWVEPGGNTVLFGAGHSLYRSTRHCGP